MKFQANKHAANYWTNALFAFFLSLGFYELSIDGPTWFTTAAFSGAAIYFAIFSKWNFENWKLKNYLNSEGFRSKLRGAIVPAVEGRYSYKNTLNHLKSQDFYSALQLKPRRNSRNGGVILDISPVEVELFAGSVREFKVTIYFDASEESSVAEATAKSWESELFDSSLDPLIEE